MGLEKAVIILSSEFEILIIDNNSDNEFSSHGAIKGKIEDLGIRIIAESNQGLTYARLRGIVESCGDYLVFIDDDNVVSSDFLYQGVLVATNFPFIGAFSGNVKLIFDEPPILKLEKYLGLLVRRELSKDEWSNQYFNNSTMPCGAGLWIKKEVASYYVEINKNGRSNLISDRIGYALSSGGDNDLAMCAIDIGLGVGLFQKLNIEHLITENRVRENYLLKLNEGIEYSAVILKFVRAGVLPKSNLKSNLKNALRIFFSSKIERRFLISSLRGQKKAIAYLNRL